MMMLPDVMIVMMIGMVVIAMIMMKVGIVA